jgi:hypothetical protein
VIVTIALAIGIYFAPRCEGQQRSRPGAKGPATENHKGRPPAVEVPYQIQNQWVQTEATAREKESPPWYKSSEWVLVIVGTGTFLVIGWQSWETRSAAQAAKASVAAMIASERSWIVIRVESHAQNEIIFRAANVGKTAATIISVWSKPLIAPRSEALAIPGDEETGESMISTPPTFLPTEATCGVYYTKEVAPKAVVNGFSMMYFYGRIRYRDALSDKIHETKFLYWYVPVEGSLPFQSPHYPEHNTHT